MSEAMKLLVAFIEANDFVISESLDENNDTHYKVSKRPKTRKSKSPDKYSDEFLEAWKPYPARAGGNSKQDAYKSWSARLATGGKDEAQLMISGVNRYAAFCEATDKVKTEYVMQGARFFGPSKQYLEPWVIPAKKLFALKLPFINEELEKFAKDNDLPRPGRTETYTEYRRRLQAIVDKRNSNG